MSKRTQLCEVEGDAKKRAEEEAEAAQNTVKVTVEVVPQAAPPKAKTESTGGRKVLLG